MNKKFVQPVLLLLLLMITPVLYAGPPIFILGLYGGPEVVSEDLLPAETEMQGKLEASLGWRGKIFEKGYVSIVSQAAGIVATGWIFEDQEFFQTEMSLPAGPGRIEITAGLFSSVLGISESPGFINPDWGVRYRLDLGNEKSEGELEYTGYSLVEPDDTGDIIFQGARLTFSHRFSIRSTLAVSLGFGYEGWYETSLYSETGTAAAENREDILLDGKIVLDGLAGYFTEWTIPVRFLWRNSNSNAFYLPDLFVPDSNSRIQISAAPTINFSPHRTLNFGLNAAVNHHYYLQREAFEENGTFTGELLHITSTGGGLSLDWTQNHRLYLVLTGDAGYTWSNDPFETGWFFTLYGGVEISF